MFNRVVFSGIYIHETGAIVRTITFDGADSNISMTRHIGADLHNQVSSSTPSDKRGNMYYILGPSSYVKACQKYN